MVSETFLASYGLLIGQQTAIVSIGYLLAGLLFTFTLLNLPAARIPRLPGPGKAFLFKGTVLLLMIITAGIISRYWMDRIPLDPDFADMLPVMKVMNERLLHGQWRQVYHPISEIWNGTRPIYLPAMWLPYAPAILCHVDMRWITVLSVLSGFILIIIPIRVRGNGYFGYLQMALCCMLFWWLFARNDIHGLISMSEEGVVIFYFVLLTAAIISGNALLIGLAASFCLLSRYSLIGWLVPCLLFFISRREYRKMLVCLTTGITVILFLYLIPFGSQTLPQMISLPGNYIAFAKKVWENTPEVYWLNLGMAKFYGPRGLVRLHSTLLISSFAIPFLFMCFCLLQKKWKFKNINLACFKLSLLIFYQFIDVPYGYLFYPASFVSLMIAAGVLIPGDGKARVV